MFPGVSSSEEAEPPPGEADRSRAVGQAEHDVLPPERAEVLVLGHQAEASQIAAELAAIARTGTVLPGSITQRRTRCHADPPRLHGPYWQWTRKVAAKTFCRWLSTGQHHDYQAWVDNDRLRELLARLEALGAAAT